MEPPDTVSCDLLSCKDPSVFCQWLSKFVIEVRQESGKFYPPKSPLYSLWSL